MEANRGFFKLWDFFLAISENSLFRQKATSAYKTFLLLQFLSSFRCRNFSTRKFLFTDVNLEFSVFGLK